MSRKLQHTKLKVINKEKKSRKLHVFCMRSAHLRKQCHRTCSTILELNVPGLNWHHCRGITVIEPNMKILSFFKYKV